MNDPTLTPEEIRILTAWADSGAPEGKESRAPVKWPDGWAIQPDVVVSLPHPIQVPAKGVVEVELVSSGEKWGRGPRKDIHSSLEAQVDSPSWHLVQALNTLVEKDGHTPAVEGFFERVKPLSDAQRQMVLTYAATVPERT